MRWRAVVKNAALVSAGTAFARPAPADRNALATRALVAENQTLRLNYALSLVRQSGSLSPGQEAALLAQISDATAKESAAKLELQTAIDQEQQAEAAGPEPSSNIGAEAAEPTAAIDDAAPPSPARDLAAPELAGREPSTSLDDQDSGRAPRQTGGDSRGPQGDDGRHAPAGHGRAAAEHRSGQAPDDDGHA